MDLIFCVSRCSCLFHSSAQQLVSHGVTAIRVQYTEKFHVDRETGVHLDSDPRGRGAKRGRQSCVHIEMFA